MLFFFSTLVLELQCQIVPFCGCRLSGLVDQLLLLRIRPEKSITYLIQDIYSIRFQIVKWFQEFLEVLIINLSSTRRSTAYAVDFNVYLFCLGNFLLKIIDIFLSISFCFSG